MAYVTTSALRASYGTGELLDAGAHRDPRRLVSAELLEAVVSSASTASWSAEEIAAAEAIVNDLDAACVQACTRVDSALRARWPDVSLPVTSPSADVQRIALWIARYFAHSNVMDGSIIARRYSDALGELREFAMGRSSLGLDAPTEDASTPVVGAPTETYTADLLDTMP